MILDTNALSAFLQGIPEVREAAFGAARLCLPLIVVGEYRFGIEGSAYPAENERRFTEVLRDLEILALTMDTTIVYGRIAHTLKIQGRPIPHNDIWVAALARQHDMPILSRDVHFDAVAGVQRVSW
jgi:tRNA(fMet)-specific endonuclease VapC